MKQITIALLAFFWIILAVDCFFIMNDAQQYRVYTKTLLVPLLLVAVLVQTNTTSHKRSKLYLALALTCSFAGDLFLLGGDQTTWFMSGLSFFLIAHIFYIAFFFQIRPFTAKSIWLFSVGAVAITAYIIFLLASIWAKLKPDFAIAVTFYSIFIGGMMLAALHTAAGHRIKKAAYFYFIPGAVLFIISDSLLALDKFSGAFAHADILIMITYGSAQFLLCTGGMKVIKSK